MKKLTLYILFISTFLSLSSCKSIQNTSSEISKTIPYFTFATLDGKPFVKDSFDSVRTKFIFYFNSECDHCQKQGKWLSEEIEIFKDLEMVFISYEELEAIKNYRDKFNFYQKNIIFLEDTRLTFSNLFGAETFPSILIYSKEGELVMAFKGETRVSEILKFIK